ncbi:uncharacterized protein LODBEIA_P02870 [Lodderomyces beijingensis]|uniref:Pseudouridine synthase RsuA/RluA-like domain-containing protein n=1 Tax=Lodderomyces beijingensis TaxID=1775926 RepID=A0ABP0ZER1_9ASCO
MSRIIVENGIRKVLPHYVNFKTHPKKRWVGKTLVELFKHDFGEPESLILDDIASGSLYVENNVGTSKPSSTLKGIEVLKDRRIELKDLIHYCKHVHEPSIAWNGPVKVIFEDDDVIVVDKPAGIPTHPTGAYNYNTFSAIVKDTYGLESIWTCHRLDKVTSGILILCKNKEAAVGYSNLLVSKKDSVKKTYLARVDGKFPEGKYRYTCPTITINMNGYIEPDNLEALKADTSTLFERVRYNENLNQSIVKCQPISGKFHQIRIHLTRLGYPISNDYFYKPKDESSTYALRCKIEHELYAMLFKKFPQFSQMRGDLDTGEDEIKTVDMKAVLNDDANESQVFETLARLKAEHSAHINMRKKTRCKECNRLVFEESYVSVDSRIYLHSLSFEFGDSKFETDLPSWSLV